MDNLASAQEHQVTPEEQELAPISGIREKIQPPESLHEAKERVSSVSEQAATEAKTFTESVLSGPEYEAAQQPIFALTEGSLQKTRQETLDALNAELASVDAGWDEVSEPAAEAPVEQGLKEEETPVEQKDNKEETKESKEKEKAEDKEKERFEKLEEITQRLDEIIIAFNKNGLKSNKDLIYLMKTLRRDGSHDKFIDDARFAKLALLIGRFEQVIKGQDTRWNKARQEDFEKDFIALKKDFGIEAQVSANTTEAPAVQSFEKAQVASTSQAPEAMRRTPPATQESPNTNEAKTESTFEAAAPKKKLENMDVDEYETHMMMNIKGREEQLERLYAIPASQRTAEHQHDIDYMELTNGMERKSIEKRREELKLKELEDRAEQLNADIENILKSVPASASTAIELAGAETSGAMVLAGEENEQQDALALKRTQLAEVMSAIQSSQAHIAELGAAIAQLDRIRRRMQKPVAEAVVSAKQAEATVGVEDATVAQASVEASSAAAYAASSGSPGLDLDPNYKGDAKKETEKGPDMFDAAISAIHGHTAPLEQKISKAVDKLSS